MMGLRLQLRVAVKCRIRLKAAGRIMLGVGLARGFVSSYDGTAEGDVGSRSISYRLGTG